VRMAPLQPPSFVGVNVPMIAIALSFVAAA
jgi:hypothetical protein